MCSLATPAILRTSVHFPDPCCVKVATQCILAAHCIILPVQEVVTATSGWIILENQGTSTACWKGPSLLSPNSVNQRQLRFHPSDQLQTIALKQTNSFSNGLWLHSQIFSFKQAFPLWLQLVVIISVWQIYSGVCNLCENLHFTVDLITQRCYRTAR